MGGQCLLSFELLSMRASGVLAASRVGKNTDGTRTNKTRANPDVESRFSVEQVTTYTNKYTTNAYER